MKTTVKSPLTARIAVLAMALFAIVGTCMLSAMGTAQNAWADNVPKPLFSDSVTALPFEKTDKGITVEIALEDPAAEQAAEPAAESDAAAEGNAADGTEADAVAAAEDAAAAAEAAAEATPAGEEPSAATPMGAEAKALTIKVTADKDIDAEVLVVKIGDKEVTETIDGKILKKDETVTFTLDEESVDEIAIYATEADALAAKKAASADETGTEGADGANGQDATDQGATEPNGETDAPEGGVSANSESGVTITPEAPATETDNGSAAEPGAGAPVADLLTVTFDTTAYDQGTFDVYVKSGMTFATATYDPEGLEPVSLDDFKMNDPTGETAFEGWETADGTVLTNEFVVTQNTTVTPVFTPIQPEPSFQVKFDANGHGKAPAAQKIVTGGYLDTTNLTLSADNYQFDGWYTEPECTNWFDAENTPITGEMTLYAKWTKLCTVTFDMGDHGINPMPAIQVAQGQCIAQGVETPTEPGWRFERWIMDDNNTFTPATTPVYQDMTVHAVWVEDIPVDSSSSVEVNNNPVDAPTFDIVVAKMNKDDGTCLEGAEFTLKDKAGNVIGSWTSGKAGVMVKGLRQDTTYVLHETKAPAGFGIEKPININYTNKDGVEVVNIDQDTGVVVPLTKNDDGISVLNVLDSNGKKSNTTGTTMPRTGDSQSLPLAGICFGAAALVAAGVAFAAYRKKKNQ